MAKRENTDVNESTENTEANTEANTGAGVEAAPAAEAPKVDKRHKKITVINEDGSTREVNRTDYIRELWAAGSMTRGEIRDHLKNECSADDGANDIAYQIVFAATKDLAGGPSEAELQRRKAAKEAEKAAKAQASQASKDAAKAAEAAEADEAASE